MKDGIFRTPDADKSTCVCKHPYYDPVYAGETITGVSTELNLQCVGGFWKGSDESEAEDSGENCLPCDESCLSCNITAPYIQLKRDYVLVVNDVENNAAKMVSLTSGANSPLSDSVIQDLMSKGVASIYPCPYKSSKYGEQTACANNDNDAICGNAYTGKCMDIIY